MSSEKQLSRRNFLKFALNLGAVSLGSTLPALPPIETPRSLEAARTLPYEFTKGEPGSQKVAITVDDCYEWENSSVPGRVGTKAIVEKMAELGIPITYFPVGSSLRFNPSGWKNSWDTLRSDGLLELQNHTQTHQFLPTLTSGEARWQMTEWAQSFNEATGEIWGAKYPPIVRYPGGERNDQVVKLSQDADIVGAAFWSFASEASIRATSAQTEKERLKKHLQSDEFRTGGSILLFHDLAIDFEVLQQLPDLLKELNLTPVLLSKLPGTVAYQESLMI